MAESLSRLLLEIGVAAQHLSRAVDAFDRECRRNGLDSDLALRALLRPTVSSIQESSTSRPASEVVDNGGVMLLSYKQTALALGVSVSTLRRLVGAGRLHPVAVGRRRLIARDDVAALAEGGHS